MRIRCPDCHTEFEATRGPVTRPVPCPSCGKSIPVPGADDLNLVGATFAGVEIQGLVARGSRSVVYRGHAPDLPGPVAVKVLTGEGEASPEEIERFEREARSASRLRHSNIVTVHRVGDEAGKPYIVMDYVMGKSLAVRTEAGPLPTRSAMAIISALASAVQHAHDQGIIHRDLKPENILFDESGSPRIMDFGLARDVQAGALADGTEGKIVGTPGYMPPEQALALTDEVDQQSDVYALGAILYEMLTGHPPFAAPTTALLIRKVREDEPPKPSELNPDVHADAETICLRAMERSKPRRYAAAEQLRRDAEAFLGGKKIEAVPPGVTEKAPRWLWRHKGSTGAAVLAAAIVVAFAWAVRSSWIEVRQREAGARREEIAKLVSSAEGYAETWREELDLIGSAPPSEATASGRLRAEAKFAKAVCCYMRVLEAEPGKEEIRRRIAALIGDGLLDAESAGELGKAAILRELARTYCPDRRDEILAATGTLWVESEPRGAQVTLSERPDWTGLIGRPGEWADLGPTPVLPLELPSGAYLLKIEHEGHEPARLPVSLKRGESRHIRARLLKAGTVPEGMVYIPSSVARGGKGRPGGFLIGRTEITVARYAEFLKSIGTEARRMSPAGGLDTTRPEKPVTGVTAEQARAYCIWLSKRTGRRFRLPSSAEWIRAAGGADGRPYPWGWYFDERRTAGGAAEDVARGPADTGTHPVDESPFGVMDTAGNVSEWVDPERPLPGVDFAAGGCYMMLQADQFRLGALRTVPRGSRAPSIGFRAVCELAE